MKLIKKITAGVLLLVLLTGCTTNSNDTSNTNITTDVVVENESNNEISETINGETVTSTSLADLEELGAEVLELKESDYYTDYQNLEITNINLENENTSISGAGADYENGSVIIHSGGYYVLTGELTNGNIIIEADEEAKIVLYLNGVTINSMSGPAILEIQADKLILSLVEGSINTIRDTTSYDENSDYTAAIYAQDSLTINGTGSLMVEGNFLDGIVSKDTLKIVDGNISIQAKDDGIIGRDELIIFDGMIQINAEGDGLKTTNEEDTEKGNLYLEGGNLTIKSGADSIQSSNQIRIASGTYNLSAGGKGIKAILNILLSDGTFEITSIDDSIHSNQSISMIGGSYLITSNDDGIHADSQLEIAGGTINIDKSYEGIEAEIIQIRGGNVQVVSSDDGLNAAGGNDESSINGRIGQNNFEGNGVGEIIITGGSLSVNAEGDGIDSNGTIVMSGGEVLVSGPENNGNGILDYGTSFIMTGGQLAGSGSSGMYQSLSADSTVYVIDYMNNTVIASGSKVSIYDGETIIYEFTTEKSSNAVIFASELLENGKSYTLKINDLTSEVEAATGSSQSTGFGGMGQGKENRPQRP